eukprot:g2309.t1
MLFYICLFFQFRYSLSSQGCGSEPPVAIGKTTKQYITVDNIKREYLIHLPASYKKNQPLPLILSHHGWTCSPEEDEKDSGLSIVAEEEGFAVVYMRGGMDNSHKHGPGWTWASWNAGTTESTKRNESCLSWSGNKSYCYTSCANRRQGCDPGWCDWTTCQDDVNFNVKLLDYLESELCIDTSRIYSTGQSNGAIMTFWLGSDPVMSKRLAAIAPISGSFTIDLVRAPPVPMPMISVTGIHDLTIPSNPTKYGTPGVATADTGWEYATTSQILSIWGAASGCVTGGELETFTTPLDGVDGLKCLSIKGCGNKDKVGVVRCSWNGAHDYFGVPGNPLHNGRLVWSFLKQFSRVKQSKMKINPTPLLNTAQKFNNLEILPLLPVESDIVRLKDKVGEKDRSLRFTKEKILYENPQNGPCQPGETIVRLRNSIISGVTCSPIISRVENKPNCKIGGYRIGSSNGCPGPSHFPHLNNPKAGTVPFTICRMGNFIDEMESSGFHCLLACEFSGSTSEVHSDGDAMCPKGAICLEGTSLLRHTGVCVYPEERIIKKT